MLRASLFLAGTALPAAVFGQARSSAPAAPTVTEAEQVVSRLVESYGVSGMETPVRDAVRAMLPSWAHPTVDGAGNLWVVAGRGAPKVVFIAHLDEIGFDITAIKDDGTLELRPRGGFIP